MKIFKWEIKSNKSEIPGLPCLVRSVSGLVRARIKETAKCKTPSGIETVVLHGSANLLNIEMQISNFHSYPMLWFDEFNN